MRYSESQQEWRPPCGCVIQQTKAHSEVPTEKLVNHASEPSAEVTNALQAIGVSDDDPELVAKVCTKAIHLRTKALDSSRLLSQVKSGLMRARANGNAVQEAKLTSSLVDATNKLSDAREQLKAIEELSRNEIDLDDEKTTVLWYCDGHLGLEVPDLLQALRSPSG